MNSVPPNKTPVNQLGSQLLLHPILNHHKLIIKHIHSNTITQIPRERERRYLLSSLQFTCISMNDINSTPSPFRTIKTFNNNAPILHISTLNNVLVLDYNGPISYNPQHFRIQTPPEGICRRRRDSLLRHVFRLPAQSPPSQPVLDCRSVFVIFLSYN